MTNLDAVPTPSRPLCLRLLGGFQLISADGETIVIPRRKGTALLAFLGVAMGSVTSRDKLASLLWGQSEQRLARQSLRQHLSTISQDLSGDSARILRLDGQMVSLDGDHLRVDVPEFEALIALGDVKSLTTAADLYRGEFLAGLSTGEPDFEEWLDNSRSRLRDLALQGMVRLAELQYSFGDTELAAESANRALRIDPFREDIHRRLMRMYAERGMRAAALAQYRDCEIILRRELGVAPDDETRRLQAEIHSQNEGPRAEDAGGPTHRVAAIVAGPNESPLLVGFEHELASLRQHLDGVAREGAQLVLIAGDGGSGKSALLKRFQWDQGQGKTFAAITRAHPAEQSMSFAIWRDLLDTPSFELAGHHDLTSSLVRRLAVLRGRLGNSAPLRQDSTIDPSHAFGAMAELIRIRSKDAVLTLIIEDLHFADDASLRLLFYVLRHLRQSPVLILATIRPERAIGRRVLDEILDDLNQDGQLARISLRALAYDDVESLVRVLRERSTKAMVPRARLREIWMLSDGNPGVVVESALVATDESSVPEGLHSELESRLNGLDDTAKLLAATASVIGGRIELPLLGQTAGLGEEAALRGIEALIAAGVLVPKDEALAFSRGRFHLAQYRSLLPARRRRIHLAVAQIIENAPIDDPAAHFTTLAHHFSAGGRATDAFRNVLRLAEVLIRQGAYARSKQSFRRVLKDLPVTGNNSVERNFKIEARLGLAEIEELAGNNEAAFAELRTTTILKPEVSTAAQRTRYQAALGRLNGVIGNDEIAQDYWRRAAGTASSEDDSLWQPSDQILEFIHIAGGNTRAGIDHLVRAQEMAQRRGLIADNVAVSAMLCLLQAVRGASEPAEIAAQRAIDGANQLGNSRLLAAGMHVRGVAQTWCGDASSALGSFAGAIELAARAGDLPRLYLVYGYRGHALAITGQYTAALSDLDTALRMADDIGLGYSRPLFQVWRTRVRAMAGNSDSASALSTARAALRMAVSANRPWAYSVALRSLACALAHPDIRDFVGAERAIRNALAEQGTMGFKFECARSLVAYARILQSAGERQRSVRLVRQARTLFRRMKTMLNQEAARDFRPVLCAPCGARS